MKFCNNTNFTLPKQSQRSRSVSQDGSRSLGLFWKRKTLSYNRINTVLALATAVLALAAVSALAKCVKFYFKVFYVMGKALSGELSCMRTGLVVESEHILSWN